MPPASEHDIIFDARLGRGGGIGRHAVLRGPWAFACVGSNPALGTNSAKLGHRECGDVAKWTKAEVCKTSIRRFESARRLQPVLPLRSGTASPSVRSGLPGFGSTPARTAPFRTAPPIRPRGLKGSAALVLAHCGVSTIKPKLATLPTSCVHSGKPQVHQPGWRNGRRGGLKIRYLNGCVGSTPTSGTNFPGTKKASDRSQGPLLLAENQV